MDAALLATQPVHQKWIWFVFTDVMTSVVYHDSALLRAYFITHFTQRPHSVLEYIFKAVVTEEVCVCVCV